MLLSTPMIETGMIFFCQHKGWNCKLFIYVPCRLERPQILSDSASSTLQRKRWWKNLCYRPHFRSNNHIVLNNNNLEIDFTETHQNIFKSFAAYLREGSGWVFDEVIKIDVNMTKQSHYRIIVTFPCLLH